MTATSTATRNLLWRLGARPGLRPALLELLQDEVVLAGWFRASGVLSDVELRVGPGDNTRQLEGRVYIVSLEGSVGLADGDVSFGMRAVMTRETESGDVETVAGEISDARIEALEVLVLAFDDVTATRELDASGAWVLSATDISKSEEKPRAAMPAPVPVRSPEPIQERRPQVGFSDVVRAAAVVPPVERQPPPQELYRVAPPKPSATFSSMNQAMPQRIARPIQAETEDDPVPEPGDVVEHFAFGRCEVIKTDGDRLHLRLSKDQRIKEIALEMLKVTALPGEEGQTTRHWQLARKI